MNSKQDMKQSLESVYEQREEIVSKRELYPFVSILLRENAELIRRLQYAQETYEKECKNSSDIYRQYIDHWKTIVKRNAEIEDLKKEIELLKKSRSRK